jgi:transmembrane sensor
MDDHLLFLVIKGQATPSERRAADLWRRASAANEAHFQALRAVLAATGRPLTVSSSPPPVLEVLEAAARRERTGSPTWWRRAGVAAAGIAALALAGVTLDRVGAFSRRGEFGFEEMVTGDSQTVTVSLRDGTVMRLAPRSQARIRVRERSREVQLVGRAFFSVAKRNGLPFVVKTQGGEVTVLGTQFDLDASNDDVRLVVVEGRVALTGTRGGETRVERGEEARVVDGRLLPVLQQVEARKEMQWVGRFLAFQATPLTEVALEMERAYGVRVTIADSTLATQTITNWFSDQPLDEVTRVVCAIVATECTLQDTVVIIGKSR